MGDTIKYIENAKEPNKQNKQKPYLNSEFGKVKRPRSKHKNQPIHFYFRSMKSSEFLKYHYNSNKNKILRDKFNIRKTCVYKTKKKKKN